MDWISGFRNEINNGSAPKLRYVVMNPAKIRHAYEIAREMIITFVLNTKRGL